MAGPEQEDEEFFDASYISVASNQKRGAPVAAQVAFIARVALKGRESARVLDHCCGHGRHLEHLAGMPGVEASGVDNSAAFIAEAERRTAGQVTLHQSDARDFDPPGEYDVVLSLESSIACFEPAEAAQILSQLARRLAPNGVLVIHQFNVDYATWLAENTWFSTSDGLLFLESRRFEDEGRRLTVVHRRLTPVAGGLFRSSTHSLRLRPYTAGELEDLLERAGFFVTGRYGDFNCSPADESSTDLIFTATPDRG